MTHPVIGSREEHPKYEDPERWSINDTGDVG